MKKTDKSDLTIWTKAGTKRKRKRRPNSKPNSEATKKAKQRKAAKTAKEASIKTKAAKAAMLKALTANLGIVTNACQQANLSRTQHYQWLKDDKAYSQAVEDIGEQAIDFVEGSLFKQIKNQQTAPTIFYLKTKAKHRGYIETQVNINHEGDSLHELTEEELKQIAEYGYVKDKVKEVD